MISSFEIRNTATNEIVIFGQDTKYNYIYKDGGINWGTVEVAHNTFSYPNQVGMYISSTEVRGRDITIESFCYYVLTEKEKVGKTIEEQVNYAYKRILEKKEVLIRLINPNNEVEIIVNDYYIKGKPDSQVIFSNLESENNMYFCKSLIQIYCNNPVFVKEISVENEMKTSFPKFRFPLVFPRNKGYIFGVVVKNKMVIAENQGAIETGCIITLRSSATVKNPIVTNITNGQKIKINKTMQTGEEIIINTNANENKGIVGILNGETQNYFRYWDFNNDWITVPVGTSMIGIESETNTGNLNVIVAINPVKYGLEEM